MSERPATFAAIVKTLQGSVGKTMAEMTLDLMRHFEPNDPRRLFWEWMVENQGHWDEACRELGIEPPSHGKGYGRRLQDAVMPVLAGGIRNND